MKRRLTWTVYATPLMTLTTDLGLSIRVSMFEYVRLTSDWDIFLGPMEWARAETGGADRWVLLRRGFPGVARVYSPPCPWDTHYQFSIKIWGPSRHLGSLTPVAGPIFETKNRAIFLERFFGRGITAREQVSRAVILEKFEVIQ